MKKEIILLAKNLKKTYDNGKIKTFALKDASMKIHKGEFVAIMGSSGSGKSTLLHQLGLLDEPTSGKLTLLNKNVLKLNEDEKARFRLLNLGYVFQSYNLVPELTTLENVYLSLLMNGVEKESAIEKATEVLNKVGLGDRLDYYPSELSGGQQQRVSIARALVNNPKILLADEPTANLDSAATENVLKIFKELNKKYKQTIIMVSHEPEDKKVVDRVIWLDDGKIKNCNKK